MEYKWEYPHRKTLAKVTSKWTTCGPDTLHVTFKEGAQRTPAEMVSLLQEFQVGYDLPTGTVIRDKGISGFEAAAVDSAAGLRLDWTPINGDGVNKGYFCLQVKGEWFDKADGEVTTDFLQFLDAYGIYRVTRIDIQQTTETKHYLTPWWIKAFDAGALRVIGKKYYEPRGKKSGIDDYPAGATIYHGSRTSERFARQYDKHKKADVGPPRRRDEIELKGDTCRRLWTELMEELVQGEQQGEDRGSRLHSFSKSAIRAYLPIRDTSRWMGKELPKDWAQYAEEPMNWTDLFTDDARAIQPAPKRVTSLLKSYRYARSNFGSAVTTMTLKRIHEKRLEGWNEHDASEWAYMCLFDDFCLGANEKRVMEFIDEMPPSYRREMELLWLAALQTSASNEERERDEELE